MTKNFTIPPRAAFASDPARSRGRRHKQASSLTRTAFQRDRDRVIHCTAFRRLKHKTQVFVAHADDYFRTRLTHSLEVAQIARSIARVLGLDEDLAETLALAHDLGHPPFGHAGEDVLDAAMKDFHGFDHNAQTLRILTHMEHVYPDFDGLNLTWETLEGVVKHNGPLCAAPGEHGELPWAFTAFEGWEWLEPHTFAGPEAQVAALADDIAYNNHDIDDGLRANIISIDQLLELPLVGPVFEQVRDEYPDTSRNRLIHEAVRRLIGIWVNDLLAESQRRIEQENPQSADAVRAMKAPLIGFSGAMQEHIAALRAFLLQNMYRHYTVNRTRTKARRVVRELFEMFINEPELLAPELYAQTDGKGRGRTARTVCDYIAGMTDTYAMEEHRRLLSMESYL